MSDSARRRRALRPRPPNALPLRQAPGRGTRQFTLSVRTLYFLLNPTITGRRLSDNHLSIDIMRNGWNHFIALTMSLHSAGNRFELNAEKL